MIADDVALARPPRNVRVGVIGAGWMGEAHLRAYTALPEVQVVGVVSRTASRARELATRYGVEATFSDAKAMIDALQPDGVSVTTAENMHVEPACYALEKGVGVLLEKPIASNLADAKRIADVAHSSGSILVPAHILRFTPPYQALKVEVASGRLGRVIAIAARRDGTRAVADHYAHVHPAFLTAVHDIDLVLWFTGSRVVRVRAFEHRESAGSQADLVWAQAELASGAIVSLAAAHVYPTGSLMANSNRIEVYGTDGVGVVDLSQPLLQVRAQTNSAPDWLLEPSDGGGAFGAEMAHFCGCLQAGRGSDIVSIDDAVAGIEIADGIVRSAGAGGQDVLL